MPARSVSVVAANKDVGLRAAIIAHSVETLAR
jgi:hypothetical protein